MSEQADTPLHKAIKALGGQNSAAAILKRSQATISGYLNGGNPPADVCMRIEVATSGQFKAEDLRPDLADVFAGFRAETPTPRPRRRPDAETA